MKSLIARSFRCSAAALHRFASFLNQQAYRLEHGLEGIVVDSDPIGRLLAEIRDSIRDRELNSCQGGERPVSIERGKIDGEISENVAHQIDGHPLADRAPVDYHQFYLNWLKFIEHRPGFEAAQPRIERRIAEFERAGHS